MSIASEITRLQGAKSDLKTSIEGKGVTVPSATKIDGYAALVDQIQTGGGGGHTGTVDTAGLQALGWDSTDIQWLQDHVWWDAEDDAEWAVTEANKAFGPNGATPLTWNTRANIKYNSDVRYLPKLTPSGSNFTSALNGYPHLVAIPTHGWDMSAVVDTSYCFQNSTKLRSVGDISYFVTSSNTKIQYMFYNCYSLTSLDLSHWDTQNVTNMSYAFSYCTSLITLNISGWSFTKATTMANFCIACYSLESISLPSAMNAPVLTDMTSAFENTYALTNFSLNLTAPSLTTIVTMFRNSGRLRQLKLAISSTVLSLAYQMTLYDFGIEELDLTGIDTTSCAQGGIGNSYSNSIAGTLYAASAIKLGANFFKGSFTTLYMQMDYSWSRDSIYESLYTNQTTRDSNSNAVTVKLATQAYDRLSAQDISDIATKNITLTRG